MPKFPDTRDRYNFTHFYREYFPSDIDDSTAVEYYGTVSTTGAWLITKNDTTSGTVRYAGGNSGYPTNWTGRAGLTYKYLYELFV
jgi:hypothetical protein